MAVTGAELAREFYRDVVAPILPPGLGHVDVLSSPGRRADLRSVYRAWSRQN
jgi:hypothetical protein